MDSKILALTITVVVAIVIIAGIVVYQFAQQQYAIYNIQKAIEPKPEISPQYQKCFNNLIHDAIQNNMSNQTMMNELENRCSKFV